jgi:hypothetical protein
MVAKILEGYPRTRPSEAVHRDFQWLWEGPGWVVDDRGFPHPVSSTVWMRECFATRVAPSSRRGRVQGCVRLCAADPAAPPPSDQLSRGWWFRGAK